MTISVVVTSLGGMKLGPAQGQQKVWDDTVTRTQVFGMVGQASPPLSRLV